jgi:hypothetical protein
VEWSSNPAQSMSNKCMGQLRLPIARLEENSMVISLLVSIRLILLQDINVLVCFFGYSWRSGINWKIQ